MAYIELKAGHSQGQITERYIHAPFRRAEEHRAAATHDFPRFGDVVASGEIVIV